jgi:hypothetical protein
VTGGVDRAVLGELDRTGSLAISRYTPLSPPGLGEYLGRKGRFDPTDERPRQALSDAVRKTIALGWLFFCTPKTAVVGPGEVSCRRHGADRVRPAAPRVAGGDRGLDHGGTRVVEELLPGVAAPLLDRPELAQRFAFQPACLRHVARLIGPSAVPESHQHRQHLVGPTVKQRTGALLRNAARGRISPPVGCAGRRPIRSRRP